MVMQCGITRRGGTRNSHRPLDPLCAGRRPLMRAPPPCSDQASWQDRIEHRRVRGCGEVLQHPAAAGGAMGCGGGGTFTSPMTLRKDSRSHSKREGNLRLRLWNPWNEGSHVTLRRLSGLRLRLRQLELAHGDQPLVAITFWSFVLSSLLPGSNHLR